MTVRAGFYSPFLAALGGGEKYFLTVLEEAVRDPGIEPVVLAPEPPQPEDWRRLGVDLPPGSFAWEAADYHAVTERSGELDLLVAMTNDVPPLSRARRSVALVSFPLRDRTRRRERMLARLLALAGRRRAPAALASYDLYVCNSQLTREHMARRLGITDVVVLPPPVDVPAEVAPAEDREHLILAVGRFFRGWHEKRHDVLIAALGDLVERREAAGWRLEIVGAGGGSPEATRYLEGLRWRAEGLPVTFHVDADASTLSSLRGQAALFWHAAGFGVDEARHPERLEHFGIATGEAMAHGVVPLVYAAGGPLEVVHDGVDGVHWRTQEALVARTVELIRDPARRAELARAGRESARRFSAERFRAQVRERILRGG